MLPTPDRPSLPLTLPLVASAVVALCAVPPHPAGAATGELTFVEDGAIVSGFAFAETLHFVDFDGDGDADAFVGKGFLEEDFAYFQNLGDGTFALAAWLTLSPGSWEATAEIASADLDRDGDPDIVASGESSDGASLFWWENDEGQITGTAHTIRPDRPELQGVDAFRLLDFDRDADLDVLFFGEAAGGLRWLENDVAGGTLSDWTETELVDGASGRDMEVADLDRDGDLDVVATETSRDRVTWWENSAGDFSSWTEPTVATTMDGPSPLALADVDRDGDTDVIAATTLGDVIAWWANDGSGGGWAEQAIAVGVDGPRDLEVLDVDRDGDPDVLATLAFEDGLAWWENGEEARGPGWERHDLPGTVDGPQELRIVDLDGDGTVDLAAAVRGSDAVHAWSGSREPFASPTWERRTIGTGAGEVARLLAVDLDRDGHPDVVGAGAPGSTGVRVWPDPGSADPGPAYVLDGATSGARVAAGDLDTDGDPDLAIVHLATGDFSWRENRLNQGWSSHGICCALTEARSLQVFDVDEDGFLDVVAVGGLGGGGLVARLNSAGDATAWEEDDLHPGGAAIAMAIGDWEGDGDLDVFRMGLGVVQNVVGAYRNPAIGGTSDHWTGLQYSGASIEEPRDVAVDDFDGDGQLDPIGVGTDGRILVWLSQGGEDRIGHLISETAAGAVAVISGDWDLDGDPDLAVASETTGTITGWTNGGTGLSWTPRVLAGGFGAPSALAVADLDRDGLADLVVADAVTGEVVWLRAGDSPPLFADGFESGDTTAWAGLR